MVKKAIKALKGKAFRLRGRCFEVIDRDVKSGDLLEKPILNITLVSKGMDYKDNFFKLTVPRKLADQLLGQDFDIIIEPKGD